jgi:hypothetical protein
MTRYVRLDAAKIGINATDGLPNGRSITCTLRRDGDPYGSKKNGKTGDRYRGQWNVEYTATNNIPPA